MPKIRRIASCLLLCALFWTSTALAKDFWTEGALELRGHTVELHAIVDDSMPQTLRQLQLKGHAIDAATFRAALEKHFTLHSAGRTARPRTIFSSVNGRTAIAPPSPTMTGC